MTCNVFTYRPLPVICKYHMHCPECGQRNIDPDAYPDRSVLHDGKGKTTCGNCGSEFETERFLKDRFREAIMGKCQWCYQKKDGKIFFCGDFKVDICSNPNCARAADYLCDWPMGDGKTCDLFLCGEHANRIGDDYHLCPVHFSQYSGSEVRGKVGRLEVVK